MPLRVGDEVLGALVLAATQADRRLDDARPRGRGRARAQIAVALRNARLYRDRDAVAHVLSAGLAPDQAPQVAGCEVAVRYRPAGEGVEAGGDFYEVVDTPAGAIVVIGDVAGKGAPAAALSAVSRVTLRTAARLTGDPRAALDELNHALRRRDDAEPLHRRRRGAAARAPGPGLRAAGRPSAAAAGARRQRRAGRAVGPAAGRGRGRGLAAPSGSTSSPGDTLVLYTDGVLDAALPDGARFGEARLLELVAAIGDDPDALVAAVDDALAGLRLRDDMAVFAVRCPGVVPLLARGTLDGDAERLLAVTLAGGREAPSRRATPCARRSRDACTTRCCPTRC